MVLTRIETIQILKCKLVAMIKNFKQKIRKWFKGIAKAIFKYGTKKLPIAKRKIDATKKMSEYGHAVGFQPRSHPHIRDSEILARNVYEGHL